jgi:hypothetical protein
LFRFPICLKNSQINGGQMFAAQATSVLLSLLQRFPIMLSQP